MRDSFYRALLCGENLNVVAAREKELLRYRSNIEQKMINGELAVASQVADALAGDHDSFSYKLAKAFLEDAGNKEKQKEEALRFREQIRQEAEELYMQRLAEKTDRKD